MMNEIEPSSRCGLHEASGDSPTSRAAMSISSSPFADSSKLSRPPFSDASAFTRGLLLVVIYSGTIVVAHWLAYLIRFEFHPPIEQQILFWRTLQWTLPVELL